MPLSLPLKESYSLTSWISMCLLIPSTSINFSRYFLFFNAIENIFLSLVIHYIQSLCKLEKKTCSLAYLLLWLASLWARTSFPFLKSTECIIPESLQQVGWYSLPNGWSFLGLNIHPGHVYLLNQIDINLLSSHGIHDRLKNSTMIFFSINHLSNFQKAMLVQRRSYLLNIG